MSDATDLNGCGESITRRQDVNPEEGIREYGNVTFADPVNTTYPVDTREHIEAGWHSIHEERDQAFSSPRDGAREGRSI